MDGTGKIEHDALRLALLELTSTLADARQSWRTRRPDFNDDWGIPPAVDAVAEAIAACERSGIDPGLTDSHPASFVGLRWTLKQLGRPHALIGEPEVFAALLKRAETAFEHFNYGWSIHDEPPGSLMDDAAEQSTIADALMIHTPAEDEEPHIEQLIQLRLLARVFAEPRTGRAEHAGLLGLTLTGFGHAELNACNPDSGLPDATPTHDTAEGDRVPRRKAGGYTAGELRAEAEAAGEEVSTSRFQEIVKQSGVKPNPRGSAGQTRRFGNAEIRKMANAAESKCRGGGTIAGAWRALIGDKSNPI